MRLKDLGFNNKFKALHFEDKKGTIIYFSYETPVAFEQNYKMVCSENLWGVTTGRHLNSICLDKKERLTSDKYKIKLFKLIKQVLK